MIARGLAALSAAVFFYVVFLLKIAWPVSVFVLLPLYLLALVYLLTRHNVKARRIWKSDPTVFDKEAVPELRAATDLLQNAGFKRTGDFIRPTLSKDDVRAFRHPHETVIACIHRREKNLSFEFIDFLDDGGDLTTTTDTSTQWEPRPVRRRLLIVRNADPILLLDEHRKAVHFLKDRGKNPVAVSDSRFAVVMAGRELDLTRHIASSGPFWPFRHILWNWNRPDRGYEIPIDARGIGPGRPAASDAALSGLESRASGSPAVPLSVPAPAQGMPPAAPRYRVVFRGAVREGFQVRQVKDNLAAAFRLDAAKTNTLFSGLPVLVKSGVDESTARKFADAFHRAGGRVEVEALSAAPPAAGAAHKAAVPAAGSVNAASAPAASVTAAPPGGPSSSGPAAEDEEIMRFKIQSLLATEKSAFDKAGKDRAVGWVGYVLAISSFLPYVGLVGGTIASYYGWTRRKSGGWRIIILASAGSLISSLGSFNSDEFKAIPGFGRQNRVQMVRETEKRLNVLVQSLESYRTRNGEYPESLDRLVEGTEEEIETKDPMLRGKEELYYELDSSGKTYFLLSLGPDGLAGTEDDVNPSLPEDELSETGWRTPG
jgi:hypothetical protein